MTTNPTCPPVVASSTVGSVNADSLRFHGPTVYGMSRAALVTSTEGLARDLASPKITANIVQPDPINVEGNPAGGPAGEFLAGLTAVHRFGTVEESDHRSWHGSLVTSRHT
jgi:3-oxoacyl-[acyl-carrier protein] reductase